MSLPKITSYEVKSSRTNQRIPVVNGIHLHSVYDPKKEANGIVSGHYDSLKSKNNILILGLGFAYHVNAVIDEMVALYGENFKVVVVEPNRFVYEDCLASNLLNKKNCTVYTGHTSTELYSDLEFIHFLLEKPAIIAHPASFNLYQCYFKDILTFEAPKDIGSILKYVETNEIKSYLHLFNSDENLEDVLYQQIPTKTQLTDMDFLSMALVEMTKTTHLKSLELGDR